MLTEPQETPYDLRFRLFGIAVRVHPLFWVLSAVLGWSGIRQGIEYVLLWIACVFVSILIHELGHVLMGMVFGTHGHIVLYSFGGLAIGSNALSSWWQRVLVCFAGPLAGFLFPAAIMLGLFLAEPGYFYYFSQITALVLGLPLDLRDWIIPPLTWSPLAISAVLDLIFINLFWGLLNLLPIFPLDGGQISRDVLTRISRERGLQISLGISFLLAALMAINAVVAENNHGKGFVPYLPTGGLYMALMFGMLALQSFMYLQQVSSGAYYDHHDPWGGQGRPWDR